MPRLGVLSKRMGAVMQGGNLGAQGQPQPSAALPPGTALVHPVEGFRQVVQGIQRDATPVVLHRQHAPVLRELRLHPDVPAVVEGFPGVVQQVEQEGADQVALQQTDACRTPDVEPDARLSVLGTQMHHQVVDQLLQGHRRPGQVAVLQGEDVQQRQG